MWALLLMCAHSFAVRAQSAPEEWDIYQSSKYLFSIQSGSNPDGLPGNEYLENLTSSAITGLARQIEVKVNETASLEKSSMNGISSVSYSSKSVFTTDVNLKLVVTKSYYSKKNNLWFAIAYIEKAVAISYFKKEIEDKLSAIERLLNNANDLISLGYKEKAKSELAKSLNYFDRTEDAFSWLKLCDVSASDYSSLLSIRNNLNNLIMQKIALLGHSTTIFVDCKADLFGAQYEQFTSSIKARIASEDISFVASKSGAEWVITIIAVAREYNAASYGSFSSYFSYVDAICKIFKVTTGQMIYEYSFSEKGGSTCSYIDAAKEAYKQLDSKISNVILSKME